MQKCIIYQFKCSLESIFIWSFLYYFQQFHKQLWIGIYFFPRHLTTFYVNVIKPGCRIRREAFFCSSILFFTFSLLILFSSFFLLRCLLLCSSTHSDFFFNKTFLRNILHLFNEYQRNSFIIHKLNINI